MPMMTKKKSHFSSVQGLFGRDLVAVQTDSDLFVEPDRVHEACPRIVNNRVSPVVMAAAGPSHLGLDFQPSFNDPVAYTCAFIRTWGIHSPETQVVFFSQSKDVHRAWTRSGEASTDPRPGNVYVVLAHPLRNDTDGWPAWRFW
jgi:hypothetical protein